MQDVGESQTASVVAVVRAPVAALQAAIRPAALAAAGAALFAALLVEVERTDCLASLDPQVTQRAVGLRAPR